MFPLQAYYKGPESYDSREKYKFMFHHFGCVSWIYPGRPGWNFPYEHTTEFVPVTSPVTGLIWRGPKTKNDKFDTLFKTKIPKNIPWLAARPH